MHVINKKKSKAMVLSTKKTVSRVSYSSVTKDLTLYFSDGDTVVYSGVPEDVYEQIKNNGRMLSNAVCEQLGSYKMTQMV